jgi:hypothetical protein
VLALADVDNLIQVYLQKKQNVFHLLMQNQNLNLERLDISVDF